MPLTSTQVAERRLGIGASEVAAVLGMNPSKSAYDVWLEKTGKVDAPDLSDSVPVRLGNRMEPVVLEYAAEVLQKPVVKCPDTFRHRNGVMLANLDGMVEHAKPGSDIVEAKSNWMIDTGWGEEGTDMVPDMVWCQAQQQMLCADSGVNWVARLLGRYGLRFSLYRVERAAPETLAAVEERVCEFWHNNVQKDIPPEHSLPSVDYIAKVARTGVTVEIDSNLVVALIDARRVKKDADAIEEKAKAAVLAAMRTGDGEYAEYAKCAAGKVSYEQHQRKGYVVEAGSYRKLDVKPIKGAGS